MKYLSNPRELIRQSFGFRIKDKSAVISLIVYIAIFASTLSPLFQPSKANATVTESFVRFDRLSTSATNISGTACIKTSTSGTENGVVIDFPVSWTISSTIGNWTTSTTNLPVDPADNVTTATAWPSISATATAVAGVSVQFTGGDLSAATLYCFNFTGASSTMASGNDLTGVLKTTGGTPYVDTSTFAVSVVGATNLDQISVTASVSATMTFSLGANAAALGTITSGGVTSATGITETITSNAHGGWMTWVKGSNTGAALHSTVANADITSPGSFNGTPESLAAQAGYVLDVNTGVNAPTINDEYNGSDTNSGGHIDTQFRQVAYESTGPVSGSTVTLVVRAKSDTTTPAASDYADTLTVSAAGNF